jgi:hypothetical protein
MSELEISRTKWLIAHVLVVVTFAVFTYMLVLNLRFAFTREFPQPSLPEHVLIALGVPSVLWLWGWMLTDFFRSRSASNSIAWGWFLVLGSWLAALVYFFVIWRPRHART